MLLQFHLWWHVAVLYWYFLSVAIYVQFTRDLWLLLSFVPLDCSLNYIIFGHIKSAVARSYSRIIIN